MWAQSYVRSWSQQASAGVPGAWEAAELDQWCLAGAACLTLWQGGHPWLQPTKPSPTLFVGNKPRVRSIRFATGHDAEGSQSHVHFDEKLHDSVVMVTQESDSSFLVKVGFLKILHRYEITFTLPPVRRLSKEVREAPVPSLHLKLLSVMPIPEGYSIKCEYSAHKEGVLKEEMLLACEGGTGTCVRVMVQARVMDRHHGTPMLLDGVKCVGAELEYDSEHSDWHGFD
ncbi:adipose-secreted signaling protein isoform X1 [Tursiops truncatus]|uniref:adipose-secreted signaling protein isoform X1 n=1 Tax=Tursiops truncatus TaxID=9739 RepID=UPI003CCF6D1F